jgi:protein TonB
MMKRALLVSVVAHLVMLLLFWQVSLSLSRPVARGYPRLITATLVAKPAAPTATSFGQSAAEPKLTALPEPKLNPAEKEKKPTPIAPKVKAEKPSPSTKQNTSSASGTSTSTSDRGGATTNTGGNSLKLDAPDFPFPHYITLIQFRIESNWEAPFTGPGERLATVYFRIKRSGEIEDVKLEQSSGNIVFDQAAKRAVYNANPLPPLPAGSGLETLGVHFDFVAY